MIKKPSPYKSVLFIILFTLSFSILQAQNINLSENSEISILTVGSGTSLNDAFGHCAFRIKDKVNGIDIVFGYGEYDFDTPNFYTKFAQGKLNYLMGLDNFQRFRKRYVYQNRTVREQILNFSKKEKQDLFDYLSNNYKPENRAYLYDFFYDNCATKIRDITEGVLNKGVTFKTPEVLNESTFRDLIQDNLEWNSWGSLGIDIALGSVIDKKASAREHMFLPEYIFQFFDNATVLNSNKKLIKSTNTINTKVEQHEASRFITSPVSILSSIGFLIILITYFDKKHNKISRWLDVILFGFTGFTGILLLLLWFATDHSTTAQNYNLLWAFPLNLLLIYQILKKVIVSNWVIKYLKFLVIMLCLLTLHWIIGVQVFALALIPILLAFLIRYLYLIHYFSKNSKEITVL